MGPEGKAGAQKNFSGVGDLADLDPIAVQKRPASLNGMEHLIPERIVGHPQHDGAILLQRDAGREHREGMNIIGCSI